MMADDEEAAHVIITFKAGGAAMPPTRRIGIPMCIQIRATIRNTTPIIRRKKTHK
jgi:hypothetical protein